MNDNQSIANEEALKTFLLDIDCLDELQPWTQRFNLFDVLRISKTEIRHSNVLGWLLDPNENHGLGDTFLRGVFQRLAENDTASRYDIVQLLLQDMYSFSVYREWQNIDILLVSSEEKCVFAIENKVGSHEHSNQLNRYRTILENEYADYRRIFVFLTPDGEEPSDVENWDILTYNDIIDVLTKVCSRCELQSDVKLMIDNYIDVVRRDIVNDQQLIDVCNKIYTKHKKALDLIFEHRIDGRTQIVDALKSALKTVSYDGRIVIDNDWNGLGFHTATMDRYLPPIADKGSWDNHYLYEYWLNIRDNRFYLICELGGWGVPEDQKEFMKRIIAHYKPNDKKVDEFRYKRIYRTKWYDLSGSDDLESDAEKCIEAAIADMLSFEKTISEII